MIVLIADKLSKKCVDVLENQGHRVLMEPGIKGDDLVEALKEHKPQVLVVRSTKVPAAAIDASPTLELIVRAGAGFDNIDVDHAARSGIFVSNCPGKNAVAVAELVFALLLAIDRRLADNVMDAREGRWNKALYSQANGLKDRILGVIGTGSIGREVIERAHAFGMTVIAWSRSLDAETASRLGVVHAGSPVEVARTADIVSLHVAASEETKHLANREFFEAMKMGATFINTTRDSVVDEEALIWALEARGIFAGLDVFAGEPAGKDGAFDSPLARHPRVYLTHHIGASTEQAQGAIADEAVRVISAYGGTGQVFNCVNMAVTTPATHLLTVRHLDKVGVLAAVLDELRKAHWNVHEMENLVFAGAEAACARIRFDGRENDQVPERIRSHPDVLAVNIIRL
jgi:D-3-phosphoglycerate dehydrogenase / 2-oxoglutarate reductase